MTSMKAANFSAPNALHIRRAKGKRQPLSPPSALLDKAQRAAAIGGVDADGRGVIDPLGQQLAPAMLGLMSGSVLFAMVESPIMKMVVSIDSNFISLILAFRFQQKKVSVATHNHLHILLDAHGSISATHILVFEQHRASQLLRYVVFDFPTTYPNFAHPFSEPGRCYHRELKQLKMDQYQNHLDRAKTLPQ